MVIEENRSVMEGGKCLVIEGVWLSREMNHVWLSREMNCVWLLREETVRLSREISLDNQISNCSVIKFPSITGVWLSRDYCITSQCSKQSLSYK